MKRAILTLFFALLPITLHAAEPLHGLAVHGAPKYEADFKHFDYVNPDAPKGGTLRLSGLGTFDSLNPYIVKGVSVGQMSMVYETLLTSSKDEAFTEYGLIAETIEIPEDRSFATFNIRKNAKWHDGESITADDVVFSFNILMEKGAPFYQGYYADVENVTAENDHRVTFKFKKEGNRELPLIVGQLPILPKHYWADKTFDETSLTPPLGSGPYKVSKVEAGRSITFERVKDWWGADLPVNVGRYNFDEVVIDFYRDSSVVVEAFFAGRYDVRQENIAKVWATGYDAPPVKDGRIIKREIEHGMPAGMQAFLLNTRRPIFADKAVREALQYAFDYEWSNKALAHGAYTRTDSYFENSEYAAKSLPEGRELEILNAFRDQLPKEVFEKEYKNPITDGSGNARANLRTATKILDDAGYVLGKDGIRTHKDTGVRLDFEIVENQPEFERWVLPFIRNLKRIGIMAKFRVVDTAQYIGRLNEHDFDMTVSGFGQSLSPGNEQRDYWSSAKADAPGSRNQIGIKNPVVDALVEKIATAATKEDLVAATKALDRTLLWNYYVIPQWHVNTWRVAYWDKFGIPENQAPYDLGIADTWWVK